MNDSAPAPGSNNPPHPPQRTQTMTATDVVLRALPWLILVGVLWAYNAEIRSFARGVHRLEAFGVKIESERFTSQVMAAAGPGTARPSQQLAVSAYRKLLLAQPRLKGFRMLWVDDHPENNFALRQLLGQFEIQTHIATSNAEAIEAVKRNDFDLVISDFSRDDGPNGAALLTELKQIGYPAPFLFYSGSTDQIPVTLPFDGRTNNPAEVAAFIAEVAIARP